MEWNEFLLYEKANQNIVAFKTIYVDMTGDVLAGLMLSQIVYWHLPSKNGDSKLRVIKDGKIWLAKDYRDFYDETRLSRGQVSRTLKTLKSKSLINVKIFKFNGSPTNHIRILESNFTKAYEKEIKNLKIGMHGFVHSNARIGAFKSTDSCILITETTTEITTDILTPPEGELTPPTEEKTPLRAKNDKIPNLPKNRRNAQNEWFMVPDKLEYEFHDPEHIKLLNKPDEEIIVGLTHFLENDDEREILETDIDIFFRFATKEKVSKSLINKIKNIDYILDKFDYKQYLKGFEIAQEKGKENKLSYLRKVLERAFMPKVYSQQMKLKL